MKRRCKKITGTVRSVQVSCASMKFIYATILEEIMYILLPKFYVNIIIPSVTTAVFYIGDLARILEI